MGHDGKKELLYPAVVPMVAGMVHLFLRAECSVYRKISDCCGRLSVGFVLCPSGDVKTPFDLCTCIHVLGSLSLYFLIDRCLFLSVSWRALTCVVLYLSTTYCII